MSMFENKTKPELEAGNFIAYADEPNTVVSGSGGGGGDVLTLNAHYDTGSDMYVLDDEITFNELKAAFEAGSIVHLKLTQELVESTQINVCLMSSWDYAASELETSYAVSFMFQGGLFLLTAESPDIPLSIL